jgi:hypothetical protein
MILVIETRNLYNAVFTNEEERIKHEENKLLFCEPEVRKKLQEYLKSAGSEDLTSISTLTFNTWKEYEQAAKDCSLPGSYFIKEIK